MNKYNSYRSIFWWLVFAIGIALAVLYRMNWYVPTPGRSPTGEAENVLEQCKGAQYRPACYEAEIPKLMAYMSMEDAFAVTKLVSDKDPQFANCHVVAHKLTSLETRKDPSRWKDVLLRCPSSVCNYGCLHGSMIERFRSETLTDEQVEKVLPDIMDLCEPREGFVPSAIDKTMCYHGIGHLAMYMTGGDPARAIPVCEKTAVRSDGANYLSTCIEGVFMTVFQSVDSEDFALVRWIRPEKGDVRSFCSRYGQYWQMCRRESFPLFDDESMKKASGLEKFCSYATTPQDMRSCYWGGINVISTRFFELGGGISDVDSYCKGFRVETQGLCYGGVAMRLVQIDPIRNVQIADTICALARDAARLECYNNLLYYATFSFNTGSQEFRTYCAQLSGDWKEACLNQ